ncbi:MAG: hypothetical protein HRT72_12315 [Flavobacteriales bacterium]|nr:hypothetical protein [Flavobacteriales bacterium]
MNTGTWILVIEESEVVKYLAQKALDKTDGNKKIRFLQDGVEAMHYLMQLMEYELAFPDYIYMDTETMASKDVKYSDVFEKITSIDKSNKTHIISLKELISKGAKVSRVLKGKSKLVA